MDSTTSALGREGHCVAVSGPFESAIVPCQDGSGLLCTSGTLGGDMRGAVYDFTATAFAGAFPVQSFVGASVISHDDGLLMGSDNGNLDLFTGAFQTNVVIVDGTGEFVGASGYFTATGTADLSIGLTSGTYVGELCIPDEDAGDDD